MIRQVTETTDNKYIGFVFDDDQPIVYPDGSSINYDAIQDLGGGLVRYSNSNYVMLTKAK